MSDHSARPRRGDDSGPGPYLPWMLLERGGFPESVHQGALVVVEDSGRIRASFGDPSVVTFPRSSAKPIQALPLVTSGAADAFRLTPAQIALCCASHSAEPPHLEAVAAILAAAGADESMLHCGAHSPTHEESARELVRRGEAPRRIHNNCSGKHAGMIATSAHCKWDRGTYWQPEHPLQQEIRRAFAELGNVPEESVGFAVDGCGVPAWILPLQSTALAIAKLASARGAAGSRSVAAERIFDAMTHHPEMIAGTGRFDTELVLAAERPLLSKGGAEGFHVVAWREEDGTGIALAAKSASGDARSGDFVVIEALLRLDVLGPAARDRLARFHGGALKNHAGTEVGRRRALFELDVPTLS